MRMTRVKSSARQTLSPLALSGIKFPFYVFCGHTHISREQFVVFTPEGSVLGGVISFRVLTSRSCWASLLGDHDRGRDKVAVMVWQWGAALAARSGRCQA